MSYNRNLYSSSESAIDAGMIYDQTEEKLQSEINAEVSSDITELDDSLSTFVRPNLLDNWYFVGGGSQLGNGVFPINQRGTVNYTSGTVCFDRWAKSASMAVALNSAGITLTVSAQSHMVHQAITDGQSLAGKTVTLSVLMNDQLCQRTIDIPEVLPSSTTTIGQGTPAVNGYSGYLRTLGSVLSVVVYSNSNYTGSVIVQAIKLEIGSTQTLAHQENGEWVLNEIPNFTEELTKCQREDGNFIETVPFDLSTLPASNTYGKYIGAKDKDDYVWFYMQPVHNTAGRLSMMYAVRRLINGSPVTNGFYLGINTDGSLAVTVDSPAAWRAALGAVSKSGDTISGGALLVRNATSSAHQGRIVLNNPEITFDQNNTETIMGEIIFDDAATNLFKASVYGVYTTTKTCQIIMRSRNWNNGTAVLNSLALNVAANGTASVDINQPAAWRKALNLCYAVNDTYSTSAGVNLPAIANGNSTIIYMSVHVDKSMENINTVTVTSLNGWIAGPNGSINGSASSVQFVGASGYTVACTKLSNYMVRIQLTKSSAFTNSVNNGVVVFFGTLTLKFT